MPTTIVIAVSFVLLVVAGWMLFASTPEQRIRDRIEDAREALVAAESETFLAFFTEDLEYRGRGDLDDLRSDLERWERSPIRSVHVVQSEIDVLGDEADVTLLVTVGPSLIRSRTVNVDLRVRFTDSGWVVDRFDWRY